MRMAASPNDQNAPDCGMGYAGSPRMGRIVCAVILRPVDPVIPSSPTAASGKRRPYSSEPQRALLSPFQGRVTRTRIARFVDAGTSSAADTCRTSPVAVSLTADAPLQVPLSTFDAIIVHVALFVVVFAASTA